LKQTAKNHDVKKRAPTPASSISKGKKAIISEAKKGVKGNVEPKQQNKRQTQPAHTATVLEAPNIYVLEDDTLPEASHAVSSIFYLHHATLLSIGRKYEVALKIRRW
jgi:hypothetical protein